MYDKKIYYDIPTIHISVKKSLVFSFLMMLYILRSVFVKLLNITWLFSSLNFALVQILLKRSMMHFSISTVYNLCIINDGEWGEN